MRCFDRHGAHCRAGIFHGVAAGAGDAEFGDQPQGDILGIDVGAEPAVEPHPHALRPLERHHLRGEDVREFAGAAAERQRADAADRAGVTVGHRVRRARQHDAEFRRHDVADALFGIVDIEQPYAVVAAALAHRLDKSGSGWIGAVVAAGFCGHRMILHRKGQVGPVHRPVLALQLRERVVRMQFVKDVAVDIDEIAAVAALADAMKLPDFFEQGARHGVDIYRRSLDQSNLPVLKTMPCPKSSASTIWF